jgi:hypothetical protein
MSGGIGGRAHGSPDLNGALAPARQFGATALWPIMADDEPRRLYLHHALEGFM